MPAAFHKLCLICNGADIHSLRGYEPHDLVRCRDCGFVFMKQIPTLNELESHYATCAYEKEKGMPEVTRLSYEKLFDTLDKYRQNNRILDVGCGEEWILEVAMKRGWQAYGTEFSSRAVEICRKKGITMHEGILKPGIFEIPEFDVIISSETIEHINNPREEISNIFKLLRKGGLFYVTTPNFDSYLRRLLKAKFNIIEYPEHLCYYTKSTLNRLLSQTGFSRVKLLTTGISVFRYRSSIADNKNKVNNNRDVDEMLRNKMSKSRFLGFIKNSSNYVLSIFRIGMTLKGFYIKK